MAENRPEGQVSEEQEAEALAEQARIRREKLAKLQSEGNNPYEKVKYETDACSKCIKENFESFEGKTVSIAGRLMSRRVMGKASFSHISDRFGTIQLYITRQDIGEEAYTAYKKDFDIGDIRSRISVFRFRYIDSVLIDLLLFYQQIYSPILSVQIHLYVSVIRRIISVRSQNGLSEI